MEAFELQEYSGATSQAAPTISLSTRPVRTRKSDAAAPASSSSSAAPAATEPKPSSKRRKGKGKDKETSLEQRILAAADESTLPVDTPPAEPTSTFTPALSLAFSAIALAQAKRDTDKRKKKEDRSKSISEDDELNDDDNSPPREKEGKEERRKRKEEKRLRKAEKEKRKEREATEEKDRKERKRKSKGDDEKSSKKHKRKASDGSADAAQADTDQNIAADFSQAVSNFMASSATAPVATPAKEKRKKTNTGVHEAEVPQAAAEDGEAGAADVSRAQTPVATKDKEGEGSKESQDAVAADPEPLSSPAPDRDPTAASFSPEPEQDPSSSSRARPASSSPAQPAVASTPKATPRGTKRKAAETLSADATPMAKKPATKRKKKDEPEVDVEAEDEALRERLKDAAALQEFLSSRWIDIPVLQRLEKKGIVTWKRGKYTEAEKAAVRSHLDTFATTHAMSESDVVDIIFAKGRSSARSKYPGFWADVAAQVPGRPLRYVKEAVQRMYHPNAHKGVWTKEEDETLQRAYIESPGQWVKIGEAVGRSYTDCRDRYKKQLDGHKERVSGRWTKDEEKQLTEAVKKAAEELGKDMYDGDIPWPVVAKLMGGNRTFHQCRVKWQEGMIPMLRDGGTYGAVPSSVLAAMRMFGYEHEKDIVWRDVSLEAKSHAKGAQATWRRMLQAVAPVDGKSFKEILDMMESRLDELDAGDSAKAAAAAERKEKAAERREKERLKPPARSEATPRAMSRSASIRAGEGLRSASAHPSDPSWLEAAEQRASQAESWMDNLMASRSVSVAAEPAAEPAGASAGLGVGAGAGAGLIPRSRKVSFEDDEKA